MSVTNAPRRPRIENYAQYTVYQGDTIIAFGTKTECAAQLGIKPVTVGWYASRACEQRLDNSRFQKRRIAIRERVTRDEREVA